MDRKVKLFMETLNKAGYEVYIVGGAVRNKLLGLPVADIDLTTNATPDEIAEVLKPVANKIDYVGKRFGVIIADDIEIAMFRTENYDSKKGKPNVKKARTAKEDVARRDFTINALLETIDGKVIDYFNGIKDIENKIIRAVGNANERFEEDPSRILRALYFASVLDFKIEEKTEIAIIEKRSLINEVPNELKGKILRKIMKHNKLYKFLQLLKKYQLVDFVFPELSHTVGCQQNPQYHKYDVFEHIVETVKYAETNYPNDEILVLASLLHDTAKGLPGVRNMNKHGKPSDIGHEIMSAQIAEKVLKKYGFVKGIRNKVYSIIRLHHAINFAQIPSKKTIKKLLVKIVETNVVENKEQLKKFTNKLLDFKICDAYSFSNELKEKIIIAVEEARKIAEKIINENIFFKYELPINGNDLVKMGLKGKKIGEVLNILLKNNIKNKTKALKIAEKYKGSI